MNNLSQQLKAFRRRVRMVRAWRGLAIGLCIGGLMGVIWSVLDWFGVFYSEWSWLGMLVVASGAIGALAGAFMRIPDQALSDSIDRRAALKDRLVSAHEFTDEPLLEDATKHLGAVKPAAVYPIRVGRWQGGAVALSAVAAAIFLLGNTPILLTADQQRQLQELQAQGAKVERIIKENLDDPEVQKRMSDKERRMADELIKLKRDLDKGRINKEDALQKANEIAKQAEEMMREHIKNTMDSLENADSALDKMREQAMKQVGMKNADPNLMKMSDQERQAKMDQLQQEMSNLQNQINSMMSQLNSLQQQLQNPNLSPEERKKLEEQKKALEAALKNAQKDLQNKSDDYQQLKLSKEAQEVFAKMMNHPLYKKLQELAAKLKDNAEAAARTGQPKLTKEERERLEKELEELAKKLKDDKEMEKYLQALIDAMKESGGT
jgi:hypothetical protein